jgi:hypothetical protein
MTRGANVKVWRNTGILRNDLDHKIQIIKFGRVDVRMRARIKLCEREKVFLVQAPL